MKTPVLARALFGGALAAVLLAETPAIAADPLVTVDLGGGVSLTLVLVRAGKFMQGSFPAEQGRSPDETAREVTISREFYIGKTEVTVGQYRRFTSESGYRTEAERGTSGGFGWDGKALVQKKEFTWQNPGFPQADDSPVELVTYEDAAAFDDWLAKKTGRRVELPTEAQFEYALRGGTRTRYYGGDTDENAPKIGWFSANSGNQTHPVAQKQPNEFGLYDMAGNVWEWCRDYYGPYEPGPVMDPLVTTSPSTEDKPRRVLRGGSWLKDGKNLRSAARYRNAPGSRNADNGFRVVASTEASAPAPVTKPASPANPPATKPKDGPASNAPAEASAGTYVCMALPGIGVILALLFVFLRKNKPQNGGSRFGVTWAGALDGFIVTAPDYLRGKRLHYRVRSQSGWIPGAIVLEGTLNQFVYTGARPIAVDIQKLEGFGGDSSGSSSSNSSYSGSSVPFGGSCYDASRDEEPFRGHPSAY